MLKLQLHIDKEFAATVQADESIITSKTVYSVSAGGSLLSLTVPCIALQQYFFMRYHCIL